ncbi:unnamed protein product, partial [Ectocarpus sp. 8 AP-2014]
MTFWLTRDALVHVCVDSRTPPSKLPSWLEYAGFRKIPGAQVRTSEAGLSLEVFRRFFRAKTLVRLGGSDNGRDLAQTLTDLSGAAVNPDGPAPKGMLANYTVLLTTVPPPPPSPSSPLPSVSSPGDAAVPTPGAAAAAAVAVAAAFGEEADVRDALVDRDVGESIVCRRRYRILPDFGAGDRPYVDRDYTIPSLPVELQGVRLTCVQTAQGDKRAGGSRFWRLSLMQESVVLVVFDARAQSVPLWLSASGFVLWEGVQLAGAQYRIPYKYKGLVATPDRSRRRDRDPTPGGGGGGVGAEGTRFGDGVGESFGGDGVGASRANRPRASSSRHEERRPAAAGLRRRGMSTTDAAILGTRSALSGGNSTELGGGGRASGRARAWTGGGEEAVFNGGGVAGAGAGAGGTYGTGSGGSAVFGGRPGERIRGGLQRISPLWDTGKDGPLSQMPVPFDRVGRTWSRSFNVDAAKTGGPLETSGATLGVSVSALTGQFHRTRVVTLYPRLVVRNFLGFPLEVMPTVMSPKAAAVERLAKCIPPAMPPSCRDASFLRGYRASPRSFLRSGRADAAAKGEGGAGSGSVGGYPTVAAAGASAAAVGTGHLARTVPNSEAVIIYAFNAADDLAKGLAVAAAASGSNHSVAGGGAGDTGVAGVAGDSDDHRKCVLLRAAAAATGATAAGGGDEDGGVGGFGPALATGLSRPVLADEMGETHLWVVDSNGRRHLAAAFVSLQRATVFVTLSASAQFPPFRVENRSSAETLAYRQVDAHKSMGWHILPPLSWHAFLWQEPDKPRAIQMAFASSLTRSGSDARHSE